MVNSERIKKFLAIGLEAAHLHNCSIEETDGYIMIAGGVVSIHRVEQTEAAQEIREMLGREVLGLHQLWELTEWCLKMPAGIADPTPPDITDKLVGRYATDEEAACSAIFWLVEQRVRRAIIAEALQEVI